MINKTSSPMMITSKVKSRLEQLRKELTLQDIEDGGSGRVSYTDTIAHLLDFYYEEEDFIDDNINNRPLGNSFDW